MRFFNFFFKFLRHYICLIVALLLITWEKTWKMILSFYNEFSPNYTIKSHSNMRDILYINFLPWVICVFLKTQVTNYKILTHVLKDNDLLNSKLLIFTFSFSCLDFWYQKILIKYVLLEALSNWKQISKNSILKQNCCKTMSIDDSAVFNWVL